MTNPDMPVLQLLARLSRSRDTEEITFTATTPRQT
jgi:hypothetical protein